MHCVCPLEFEPSRGDRVSFKDPVFLRLDVKSLQCVCLRSLSLKSTAKPSLSAQMSESLLLWLLLYCVSSHLPVWPGQPETRMSFSFDPVERCGENCLLTRLLLCLFTGSGCLILCGQNLWWCRFDLSAWCSRKDGVSEELMINKLTITAGQYR